MLTDPGGNLVSNAVRYFVDGNWRDENITALPTEYGFTAPRGHPRHDSITGLIYMNARYYDPELGIFISPDTVVPDPTNPLDYNCYLRFKMAAARSLRSAQIFLTSWELLSRMPAAEISINSAFSCNSWIVRAPP